MNSKACDDYALFKANLLCQTHNCPVCLSAVQQSPLPVYFRSLESKTVITYEKLVITSGRKPNQA